LLAVLHRLLRLHSANAALVFRASSGAAVGVGSRLPSYAQVLDWVRMLLDSHFTHFILLAKAARAADADAGADGGGGASASASASAQLHALLADLSRAVSGEVALCGALAPLRGQVLHLAAKGAMPRPPPPENVVELVRL
jgi:hypothetical protein